MSGRIRRPWADGTVRSRVWAWVALVIALVGCASATDRTDSPGQSAEPDWTFQGLPSFSLLSFSLRSLAVPSFSLPGDPLPSPAECLVTESEVEQALGRDMLFVALCFWAPADLTTTGGVNVTDAVPAPFIDESIKPTVPDGQDITALGDQAYWAPSSSTLYVEAKGRTLLVELSFPELGEADLIAAGSQLAESAIARLP